MSPRPTRSLYHQEDYAREEPIVGEALTPIGLATRNPFRRDYGRLIHSPAFRRLQGKTQLYPCAESDFFRNRLTHSLEVAQIAKSIALRINANELAKHSPNSKINTDLVEVAALAHDLGHPPFGHNGEAALDECMREFGGFEGNAQTLRILSRLEKKGVERTPFSGPGSTDVRVGLNLTHRTLAAVLKYDQAIPLENKKRKVPGELCKGYYDSEVELVSKIKKSVLGKSRYRGDFKTVECRIMDFADDIAYSTYDLEDSLKAGFVTPLEILRDSLHDDDLKKRIAAKVSKTIGNTYTPTDVLKVMANLSFARRMPALKDLLNKLSGLGTQELQAAAIIRFTADNFEISQKIATDGYNRNYLTTSLVDRFIKGIEFTYNPSAPAFSNVIMSRPVWEQVEVLKHFNFEKLIMSPKLKLVEYRGHEIVHTIFKALDDPKGGELLLPEDFKRLLSKARAKADKKRVICDFIAGMTDRYALEFYSRLKSETPQTIFKPH